MISVFALCQSSFKSWIGLVFVSCVPGDSLHNQEPPPPRTFSSLFTYLHSILALSVCEYTFCYLHINSVYSQRKSISVKF